MYDSNFKFGVRKAQMLITCLGVLREFYHSSDEERLAFRPRVVQGRDGLRVTVLVEMHPDFEHSSGAIVDRPWLQLHADEHTRIGLGVIKCRAVCEVQEDLKRWLRTHGVLE